MNPWQEDTDNGTYDTQVTITLPFRMKERFRTLLIQQMQEHFDRLGLTDYGAATVTLGDKACVCEDGEHKLPRRR